MKKFIPLVILFFTILISCKCSQKAKETISNTSKLEGNWILKSIANTQLSFERVYPNKKPKLSIDFENKKVQGNTCCNDFNGKINVNADKINFLGDMAMTKMRCLNENGETIFLETLKKIDWWSMPNDTILIFYNNANKLMEFNRK